MPSPFKISALLTVRALSLALYYPDRNALTFYRDLTRSEQRPNG